MYLTEQELVSRGWSASTLRAAMQAGKLRGVVQGTSFIVEESELHDWAQAHAKGGRPLTNRQASPVRASAMPGSAVAEWHAAVDRCVAAGAPRREAVKAVDQRFPGLRERMLAEHNATARRQSDFAEARAAVDRAARQRV